MLSITNYKRNASLTKMRHHLTLVKMAIIKKNLQIINARENEGKR